MKERIAYWDYLRGIAILMVVSIHCYPYDQTIIHGHIFPTFIRAFVNICVPLFLAISGYFACKKNLDSLFLYKSFIKKQLLRVYFPCIIISIPIAVFKILKGGDIVGEAIRLFICQSFSIYYFIFLIIQFYLLTPILKKIVDKPIAAGGGY